MTDTTIPTDEPDERIPASGVLSPEDLEAALATIETETVSDADAETDAETDAGEQRLEVPAEDNGAIVTDVTAEGCRPVTGVDTPSGSEPTPNRALFDEPVDPVGPGTASLTPTQDMISWSWPDAGRAALAASEGATQATSAEDPAVPPDTGGGRWQAVRRLLVALVDRTWQLARRFVRVWLPLGMLIGLCCVVVVAFPPQ